MSKSKESNGDAEVLDYLNKQNRPYSANDIYNNLHKAHGKTAVVKALETLASNGRIKEKLNGKQKAYCADQSQFPDIPDSELRFMDKKIADLSESVKTTQRTLKELQTELKALSNSMTTEQATTKLSDLTTQCNGLEEKVKAFEAGGRKVTPEEKETVMSTRAKYVKAWRKRKRIANDILDAILENYPKPKKSLYEDIGIETDEEYKVKPPQI